jgi:hypothetical protein
MSKMQKSNSPTNKTKGLATQPRNKSTKIHFPLDMRMTMDSIAARVEKLEEWKNDLQLCQEMVEEIKARILKLENHTGLIDLGILYPVPEEEQAKPGPQARITWSKLKESREQLLGPIEACWNVIADPLMTATNEQEIRTALSPIMNHDLYRINALLEERMPVLVDIVAKSNLLQSRAPLRKALMEFDKNELKASPAFNGLPSRKIANALAGVPIYPWRSSYDICRRRPSPQVLHASVYLYIVTKLKIHRDES